MDIKYVNSKGETVDLLNDHSNLFIIQNIEDLFHVEHSYDYTDKGKGKIRIKNVYVKNEPKEMALTFICDTEKQFSDTLERVNRIFEYDYKVNTMGRLYVNNYYLECFVINQSYEDFEDNYWTTEVVYNVIFNNPNWIKENLFEFAIQTNEGASGEDAKGYPYNYPYNYSKTRRVRKITNNTGYDSNFIIKFYGPCVNPEIKVGNNTYGINYTFLDDQVGIINTIDGKGSVKILYANGDTDNLYNYRTKAKDVGNEIFDHIESGEQSISSDNSFRFDIILIEERGNPKWN